MIDTEQYNYLASVEENLRALAGRPPPNTELSDQAMRALNAIVTLMECYVPDREPANKASMTDDDDLEYFTELLKRLEAAADNLPDELVLRVLADFTCSLALKRGGEAKVREVAKQIEAAPALYGIRRARSN